MPVGRYSPSCVAIHRDTSQSIYDGSPLGYGGLRRSGRITNAGRSSELYNAVPLRLSPDHKSSYLLRSNVTP
jgi:hypothetical protein